MFRANVHKTSQLHGSRNSKVETADTVKTSKHVCMYINSFLSFFPGDGTFPHNVPSSAHTSKLWNRWKWNCILLGKQTERVWTEDEERKKDEFRIQNEWCWNTRPQQSSFISYREAILEFPHHWLKKRLRKLKGSGTKLLYQCKVKTGRSICYVWVTGDPSEPWP